MKVIFLQTPLGMPIVDRVGKTRLLCNGITLPALTLGNREPLLGQDQWFGKFPR